MSDFLYPDEVNASLKDMGTVDTVEPTLFQGFGKGIGKMAGQTATKMVRGAALIGSVAPVALDFARGSTTASDAYFGAMDDFTKPAEDAYKIQPNEVGFMTEIIGGVVTQLPPLILAPLTYLATTQMARAEELNTKGVGTGTSIAAASASAALLGVGVRAPMWGRTHLEAMGIAAGFNWAQGIASRAADVALLSGTPVEKELAPVFGGKEQAIDVLLGLAMTYPIRLMSEHARTEGITEFYKAEQWLKRTFKGEGTSPEEAKLKPGVEAVRSAINDWSANLKPSDIDALAGLRVARHAAVDSAPGRPASPAAVESHIAALHRAIGQMVNGEAVNVQDVAPRMESGRLPVERETIEQFSARAGEEIGGVSHLNGIVEKLQRTYIEQGPEAGRAMLDDMAAHAPETSGFSKEVATPGFLDELHAELQARAYDFHMRGVDNDPVFHVEHERQAEAEAQTQAMREAAPEIARTEGLPPADGILYPVQEQLYQHFTEHGFKDANGNLVKMTPEQARQYVEDHRVLTNSILKSFAKAAGQTPEALLNRYLKRVQTYRATPDLTAGDEGAQTGAYGRDRGSAGTLAQPEELFRTVGGGTPEPGWSQATRIRGKDGQPATLHRGAEVALKPEHFDLAALGRASGNPSSGLGVWLTVSKSEAGSYGNVESFHLDIRNPFTVKIENLPGFDSTQEAHRWREQLRSEGYDGLIVSAKHLGGRVHVVAFEPHQVIPTVMNRGDLMQGPRAKPGPDAPRDDGTFSIIDLDANVGSPNEFTGSFKTRAEAEAALKQSTGTQQQGITITPEMRAKAMETQALFQKQTPKGEEQPRGFLNIDANRQMTIGFLEATDPSTALHEPAHFFLEMMDDLAADVPALERDMQVLFDEWGLTREQWNGMDLNARREYHEQFARGFEQYLMTAEAPTPELKGVFQRFRDWLIAVYKSAGALNVKVSDAVKSLYDRMLDSERRDPATAQGAPNQAGGPPPPPPGAEGSALFGEAPSGPVEWKPRTIDDQDLREVLRDMVENESGWAQRGGNMIRMPMGNGEPDRITRTTWIPKAEWWTGRPDKRVNEAKLFDIMARALSGEEIKPKEQATVDYMVDMANQRLKAYSAFGREEWEALTKDLGNDLEPTTQNIVDADQVAIALQIDDAAVERLAIQHADDDAGFMAAIRSMIDEHQNAATAEGRPEDSQAPAAPVDILANEATRFVAEHPDLELEFDMGDGTTQKRTVAQYLTDVQAEAQRAREDAGLFEVAAECMLGAA